MQDTCKMQHLARLNQTSQDIARHGKTFLYATQHNTSCNRTQSHRRHTILPFSLFVPCLDVLDPYSMSTRCKNFDISNVSVASHDVGSQGAGFSDTPKGNSEPQAAPSSQQVIYTGSVSVRRRGLRPIFALPSHPETRTACAQQKKRTSPQHAPATHLQSQQN